VSAIAYVICGCLISITSILKSSEALFSNINITAIPGKATLAFASNFLLLATLACLTYTESIFKII